MTALLSCNFSFNHKAFISKHLDAALYIKGYHNFFPLYLSQILTDWQDKKGDKRFLKLGKDPDPAASSRHKPKKQKLDGKGGHGPGQGPGRPKTKNLQPKVQEYEFTDDPQDIPRNPKNDAPNRSATTYKIYLLSLFSLRCFFFFSF